ncbi:MAG TPA: thiazole biosynthesis adenylyltransferase ThiF, partial [Anaerolineae bacterium]
RRPDCPTCGKGEYDYLEGERSGAATAYLCGRDAVQVNPGRGHTVSLLALAERLRPVGQVSVNDYLVKFTIDSYELTIFPDARAIVKGTDDAVVARSLYAKYVGI